MLMPNLRELGLDQNPSEQPLSYPGRPVPGSCLLVDDWLYPMLDTQGDEVAEWSIENDEGPLSVAGRRWCTVEMALRAMNSAPMAKRKPVVAVGSNASPGQLAYISKPGYVPYIPLRSLPEHEIELHALWLDTDQARRMDETEPNYRRLCLRSGSATMLLESGDRLPTATLYAGRWGALRLTPDGTRVPATTQARIFTLLGSQEWFQKVVPESLGGPEAAMSALGHDAERRERVRQEIAGRHLAVSDDLSI
jgi:hypothetical protein